ncbi:MAG: GWxTD domain-containing protein [Acidobacteria bacterium]|jgi:GWxTD domain-containing protein|nr:GWxTD domain-containing protein [Acidobacteriota bacterium]
MAIRTGALALLLALAASCGAGSRAIERDPYFESFYEKTRLIMTDEEVQIYKHLADAGAREEFIEEFWQKRDPLPDTAENEARDEFARRIAYANRWFRENRSAGRGWDTPRGRILIQLGEPDNRYLNDMINDPNVKGIERWVYYAYQLELVFVDSAGFGEYKLRSWPPELLSAIDHARFAVNPATGGAKGSVLTFQAGYRDGRISIAVPLKRVRFSESAETIQADFRVTVYVYRDYAKVDTRVLDQRLQFPRQGLPGGKNVDFSLPLPLTAKGRYFLDVILQDLLTGARSRDFVDFKL